MIELTKENCILIQAPLIIGIYMIVRAVIYLFLPATSQYTWFYRDCWMTIPRSFAFC